VEARTADREATQARRHVALTAAVAGLGGLLFGYDTGIIAGALLFITPDFGLSSFESGVVVSAVPLGAVAGAMISGRLSDRSGRKTVIIISAVIFAVGAFGSAAAPGTVALVIARLVIGLAIGLASAAAPVYISEVAPPEHRGRLVSFFQLAVTVGILLAYLVSLAFQSVEGWRWMLGLGAVPAFVLGAGMLRMPPSPRWLVMAGREREAREVLRKIRVDDGEAIETEVTEIRETIDEDPGNWRDLLEPLARAALMVGVGLAILQQISGINTVIYYAPTIVQFTGVGSSATAILATVGVGVINVAATVVALRLLDRVGRRPLLIGGAAVMGLALTALGAAFLGKPADSGNSVIAVVALMVYVAAFAVSLGPIFWLMNAELHPLNTRSKAAAVGTMANWTFNFIVSLTFLLLIDAAGRSGTFFIYAGICGLTVLFCWRFVPETKGRPLEEIEDEFRARLSN
jgi:sugar porter (SP) family MFS transporter